MVVSVCHEALGHVRLSTCTKPQNTAQCKLPNSMKLSRPHETEAHREAEEGGGRAGVLPGGGRQPRPLQRSAVRPPANKLQLRMRPWPWPEILKGKGIGEGRGGGRGKRYLGAEGEMPAAEQACALSLVSWGEALARSHHCGPHMISPAVSAGSPGPAK